MVLGRDWIGDALCEDSMIRKVRGVGRVFDWIDWFSCNRIIFAQFISPFFLSWFKWETDYIILRLIKCIVHIIYKKIIDWFSLEINYDCFEIDANESIMIIL